jgi:hypothetical protein
MAVKSAIVIAFLALNSVDGFVIGNRNNRVDATKVFLKDSVADM